jgi:hypothetical protein
LHDDGNTILEASAAGAEAAIAAEAFTVVRVGAASMKPSIGEESSIRPGSRTDAKAQDGLPGNLEDPAHVQVSASRQSGRPLNNDPGPESTHTTSRRSRVLFYRFSAATLQQNLPKSQVAWNIQSPRRHS